MTPIYPCLLALTFRMFGSYSAGSAIFILSLNSLFSALTCLPMFFMTRRTFGERTAFNAAWVWALFPFAVFFAGNFIWSTVLTTLLLAIAFAYGLRLEESSQLSEWVGFGILSGIAALSDPIVISVLPLVGAWICYRRAQRTRHWVLPGFAAAAAFLLLIAPWCIRNYRVFHSAFPLRDNFGLELYVGNDGQSWHWAAGPHPAHNEQEWQEYERVGELPYMRHKQQQAMDFISQHKAMFVWLSFRRAIYAWTNFWSFSRAYLQEEPFDIPAAMLITMLSILALWGLWIGWQDIGQTVVPYAIALFFFPVVYYVTHLEDYYRRPVDPFFVMLATYAVTSYLESRRTRTQEESLVQPEVAA